MIPDPSTRNRGGARMAALGGLSIALLAGCEQSTSVKSGAPQVVSFGPVSADGTPIELVTEAGVVPAPPLTNFVAIFDRLLDGDSLEDADGGIAKAGLAQVQSAVATQIVALTTNYVPNGDSVLFALLPKGPSLTVMPVCGLPAAGSLQVSLELTKLRSHDRKTTAVASPGVPTAIVVTTEPLSVTTDIPPPTVLDSNTPPTLASADPTAVFNLTFNAITPGPAAPPACNALASTSGHIHVTAQVGGGPAAPIAALVEQDMTNPLHWTVSPPGTTADGPGSWPADAVVTVTIDEGTSDSYGVVLGTATNASFMVKS